MKNQTSIIASDTPHKTITPAANHPVETYTPDSDNVETFLNQVENQLQDFSDQENIARLDQQNTPTQQWRDPAPSRFTRTQRDNTTILHAGLTMAHDLFLQSAFRGMGYKVEAMPVPDNNALQYGREFGNRGQCNPTYFTVGNLIKKLKAMESQGIDKKTLIDNYIFVTVGSCGPCRFGTYVTEYRKALRDSGFEGFRVLLVQQSEGIKQATGETLGLEVNTKFFLTMVKAVIVGDIINALGYRIRPYEINPGETQKIIEASKERIAHAFEQGKGLHRALRKVRKDLSKIPVDKTMIKPKVAIIGEFWAMTTEGDGNYKMQQFLENEGAEVDVQLAISWPLYLLWGALYDTNQRAALKGVDKGGKQGSRFALDNINVAKKRLFLKTGDNVIRGLFYVYAKLLGLKDYHLPDMNEIAKISHEFYDNNLRGGEGHMEVGKLIQNVVKQKVNMTLSIKPFGCMPSSGVSDGVQSLITERYPNAIFLPIETSGDGAVNVYSRVQMQLFKARQLAEKETQDFLSTKNVSLEQFKDKVTTHKKWNSALHRSPHKGANTTLDLAHEAFL